VVSGPSDGETCDACDLRITKDQLVMEATLAGRDAARPTLRFHVACLRLWDAERSTTARRKA
jgi:hypothetical protein